MNSEEYKSPILVGVLFLLFSREWFDDLMFSTFPSLKTMPWVYLALKVLLVMVVFWGLDKFVNN